MTFQEYIEKYAIKAKVTYKGIKEPDKIWNQLADKWEFILVIGNRESKPIQYKTGLGLRKISKTQTYECTKEENHKRVIGNILSPQSDWLINEIRLPKYAGYEIYKNTRIREIPYQIEQVRLPKLEDVLSSIHIDVSSVYGRTFAPFCADNGYDEDSRTAERIYFSCIEEMQSMTGFLPNIQEFLECTED